MPEYRLDMLVQHPAKPEWGPGKILAIEGTIVTVYFRDAPEAKAQDAVKRIDVSLVELQVASSQSDQMLANLPPFKEGKLELARLRLTLAQAIDMFFRQFPRAFGDPDYERGERGYKLDAHNLWVRTFGGARGRRLLDAGMIAELVDKALAVDGHLNLLSPYEKMALRDGLKDRAAAVRFFDALFTVLEAPAPSRETFEPYIEAVSALPAEEGRARVATWPVLTLFPYVAQPDRHMFLKPEVTKNCAEVLAFDLRYSPTLNWTTYESLLRMCEILMTHLAPRGARDLIDVQPFIWVIARLAEGAYGPPAS